MHFLLNPSILLTLSVSLSGAYGAAVRHAQRSTPAVCYEDNALRSLERFPKDASAFCPAYLKDPSKPVPSQLGTWPASRLSSACACFEKTAAPAGPASTPTTVATSATQVSSTKKSSVSIPTLTLTSKPVIVPSPTTLSSTSSVPRVIATGGPSLGGKRGLVYDYTSKDYVKYYTDSKKIAFGSDWGDKRSPAPGVDLPSNYNFIPTLRVDGSKVNNDWINNVKAMLQTGTKVIFASNEPDNGGQANLSPADAAAVYKKYIQPFQGQASLASPAVTNGGGSSMGLGYLASFMSACADCTIDIINVHHYVDRSDVNVDQAVSAVQSYLSKDVPNFMAKYPQLKNAKICVGEFWLWDSSDDEGAQYLTKLLPWLDSNDMIACYQAFGGLWRNNFINSDGTGLSKSGQVYHDL
ncbi:MAG: hypothetical protein Q9190_005709 [Brigantiaea leucoxantha]